MQGSRFNVLTGQTEQIVVSGNGPVAPTRQITQITFEQLIIGMVTESWISEADGDAWLTGTLPTPVLTLINQLPAGKRFAARAKALRPNVVRINDRWIQELAALRNKTNELPSFFNTYGAL